MKTVYFATHDGLVLTEDAVAGEQALSSGRAFKAETPDVSSWRLSLNIVTKEVIVYGGVEKTEAQAITQKNDEARALQSTQNAEQILMMKNNERDNARAKELRKQLLASKS
jgi:hypothetical protein